MQQVSETKLRVFSICVLLFLLLSTLLLLCLSNESIASFQQGEIATTKPLTSTSPIPQLAQYPAQSHLNKPNNKYDKNDDPSGLDEPPEKLPKLHIIYYAFLIDDKWRSLIETQLNELVEFGLYQKAESISLIFSRSSNSSTNILQLTNAKRLALIIAPKSEIFLYSVNQWEYPGIKRMWDIAHKDADPENAVILYFHAKGIWHPDAPLLGNTTRSGANLMLTNVVLRPWRSVLGEFQVVKNSNNEPLMKACYIVSGQGYCWYNFAYVRASYVKKLVTPIVTDNRLYYEFYLSKLAIPQSSTVWRGGEPVFELDYLTNALTLCRHLNPNWQRGVWKNPGERFYVCT